MRVRPFDCSNDYNRKVPGLRLRHKTSAESSKSTVTVRNQKFEQLMKEQEKKDTEKT